MSKSLAEIVAELPQDQQLAALADISAEELEYSWEFWGRPEQMAPEGFWTVWLIVAGRGFGKTRAGAEWVRKMALENPGCRIALVGRSAKDVGGTMIHGESGIMAVHSEEERPVHKVSIGELHWPNGSIAQTFTAEEPDQLRGPQFHYAWADEAAAWKFTKDVSGLNAWGNLRFATRLGAEPRILATTTPRRTEFMVEILEKYEEQETAGDDWDEKENGRIVITRGSTFDNRSNLAATYISDIVSEHQGTNLYTQELLGEMPDEREGALWSPELIDACRWYGDLPNLPIKVVALDPSVAENPRDEAGIIVVGATGHKALNRRHAFILEDATVHGSPDLWAERVVEMAHKWNAPVVAEGTQGQQLVANMIRSIDPTVKVLLLQTGQKGKKARADLVLPPYVQKRVHHVEEFDRLELQLTTWDPEISKRSPDRLDALVHGVTALLVKIPKGLRIPSSSIKSIGSRRQLPNDRGTGRTRVSGELGKFRRQ